MDFGPHFPGKAREQKPESHYLYQLANAHAADDRRSAVKQLFETQNQNLFSTVVGIAMDDPSSQLRLEALQQAHNLSPQGQRKLKDSLIRMSNDDPSQAVRHAASELVQKYYN